MRDADSDQILHVVQDDMRCGSRLKGLLPIPLSRTLLSPAPMPSVLVLNGPNLNLLGQREPGIYGADTLEDIETDLKARFPSVTLRFEQHNGEGDLIEALHAADRAETTGVVLNAAGYTHTSVALRDAIVAIQTPVVEVHISNVYAREPFRHTSLMAANCAGVLTGFGVQGYALAVAYFAGEMPAAPTA